MGPSPPPYQWRAEGGYRYPSPPKPPPPTPHPAPAICLRQEVPEVFTCNGQHFLRGPLGVNGVYISQPQQVHINYPSATPPEHRTITFLPPPPTQAEEQKREEKKTEEAKEKTTEPPEDDDKKAALPAPARRNLAAKPKSITGFQYMYPMQTTKLHIFTKARRIWDPKYKGAECAWKGWHVDTQATVKSIVEGTMGIATPEDCIKCTGWAITEVVERGDGEWIKGTSIEYGTDKASGTLASMGWTAKRGESLPPVWLTVHLVKK